MKKLIILIGVLIFSFSPDSHSSSILKLNDTVEENSTYLHISFISNRPIAEYKFSQIRERFKNTFTEFTDMSIDRETQRVIIIFTKGVNQETINKVISYFKPKSFETY